MNVCFLSQNTTESEEVVWTGSGTILPHELKECNLEMTCPKHEPSVLASLRVQLWGLCFLLYTLMTCLSVQNCSINMYADYTVMCFTNLCTLEIAREVQYDVNGVVKQMDSSRIGLNQSKTKSLLFGSILPNDHSFVYSYTERLPKEWLILAIQVLFQMKTFLGKITSIM